MTHWSGAFYRSVDSSDPGVVAFFAPDVRAQVGNAPASVGIQGMFDGPIGRIVAATRGARHEFINIWDTADDTAVLECKVVYHRRDGVDVQVAATTILQRNPEGLIADMRLYIDTAPLFEGWIDEGARS